MPGVLSVGQAMIFEKFLRLGDRFRVGGGGGGLGLAIWREIMVNPGGSVSYLPGQGGGAFALRMPVQIARTGA